MCNNALKNLFPNFFFIGFVSLITIKLCNLFEIYVKAKRKLFNNDQKLLLVFRFLFSAPVCPELFVLNYHVVYSFIQNI